jgi:hypothetical protein
MVDRNETFEPGHFAREQQKRIAAAACMGLNAAKPILEFQVSMLRLWANNVEMVARNCEKGLETFSTTVEKEVQQRAA